MQNEGMKTIIQNGFDTVSQGYDHPALSFFPETAQHMMQYLELQPSHHVLDVCTGTGVVALCAASQLPDGKVTGIDLSTGMLKQARFKATKLGLTNTEFLQMDLDELDLPNEYYDVATSSFGLFFMEDMVHALNNISQTIKPSGKIAISSFAGSAFSPMADVFLDDYENTGRIVPELSWKRLSTEQKIREPFEQIGIDDVSIHHLPLGYHMTSSDMWWDVVWNAGWRSLLNLMSEEERIKFKESHLKKIESLIGDDGIWFNTEVLIAIAEKPD